MLTEELQSLGETLVYASTDPTEKIIGFSGQLEIQPHNIFLMT